MISVVIPALNEVQNLPRLLAALRCETAVHEVIVVDGGSRDMTVDEARKFDVQVVESQPGRGVQLRCGADVATGDVFLFLHADSEFPAGGLDRIVENLAMSPAIVGGNFRLLFSGEARFSRWLTRYYAWIRRRGLYYGDSAIFVRRDVYDTIGGMRPIALMEDFDFVRRIHELAVGGNFTFSVHHESFAGFPICRNGDHAGRDPLQRGWVLFAGGVDWRVARDGGGRI